MSRKIQRIYPRFLIGTERLEDRRLLSVNAALEDLHEHALGDHAIPFDSSDWSVSTISNRFGMLSETDIFNLQSKPDSNFTVYLDFDGHVTSGTAWNSSYGIDPIVSPSVAKNLPGAWAAVRGLSLAFDGQVKN